MSFHVANKKSPSPDTVYVQGGTKKELESIVGYKVISKQDWGNWIFLIKREDLSKLEKKKMEKQPLRCAKYGHCKATKKCPIKELLEEHAGETYFISTPFDKPCHVFYEGD